MTDYAKNLMQFTAHLTRLENKAVADPLDQALRAAEQEEHALAVRRGSRVRSVADAVAWELFARGVIQSGAVRDELRKELVAALARVLYPGSSVDL